MTLEEAKQEYFKYNCSTYGMFRDGDRYEEFCALNIPLSTLNAWSQERFDTTYEKFRKTRSYDLFLEMDNYSEENHNKKIY